MKPISTANDGSSEDVTGAIGNPALVPSAPAPGWQMPNPAGFTSDIRSSPSTRSNRRRTSAGVPAASLSAAASAALSAAARAGQPGNASGRVMRRFHRNSKVGTRNSRRSGRCLPSNRMAGKIRPRPAFLSRMLSPLIGSSRPPLILSLTIRRSPPERTAVMLRLRPLMAQYSAAGSGVDARSDGAGGCSRP